MRNQNPNKYVISAARDCYTKRTNDRRHSSLVENLKLANIPCKEVIGMFEGIPERAMMIVDIDKTVSSVYLIELLTLFNQDCGLHIDGSNSAFFFDKFHNVVHQGDWCEVSSVKPGQDHTIDPVTGKIYIIR